MSMFLTSDEVGELTGIKRGRDGKTAHHLQCEHLRLKAIPFYVNARSLSYPILQTTGKH
jgi:hypothetical protein